MEWNNGFERARFETEQKRQAKWYRKAGMTEEQISAMYEYDKEVFNEQRAYECHTVDIPLVDDSFDEDVVGISSDTFAYEYQPDVESVEDWINSMESEWLIKILKGLNVGDQTILKLAFYDGYSETNIARIVHRPRQSISRRIVQMKKMIIKGGQRL